MARLFSFGALIIGGIIVADILIHPAGTSAASAGVTQIEKPAFSALLGTAPGN
jgi:hypothetical protein